MPIKVPTPRPKESAKDFKNRAFAAQVQAQLVLQGRPAEYRQFCEALKAEWATLKARKDR
jgi:hypothetical protein